MADVTVKQELLALLEHLNARPVSSGGLCCSVFCFLLSVLWIILCLFVLFSFGHSTSIVCLFVHFSLDHSIVCLFVHFSLDHSIVCLFVLFLWTIVLFILPFAVGPVVVVIVWYLELKLLMQSVHITTNVVISNLVYGEMYSIQHFVIKFVSDLRKVSGFLYRYSCFPHQ